MFFCAQFDDDKHLQVYLVKLSTRELVFLSLLTTYTHVHGVEYLHIQPKIIVIILS